MNISLRMLRILLIGLLPSTIVHAQSGTRIDMQSHFGTLSLRATKGQGKVEAQRYWLYVNADTTSSSPRMIKGVGGGGSDAVTFLPIEVPLTPGEYSVHIVTYSSDGGYLPSFCMMIWKSITIEPGRTTKFTIGGLPGYVGDFLHSDYDARTRATITMPSGGSIGKNTYHRFCPSHENEYWYFNYEMILRSDPASASREGANWVKTQFQKAVIAYDKDGFVAWARDALRAPPSGARVTLPDKVGGGYLPGYEVDAFQVRVLIDRLRKEYGLGRFSHLAFENEHASLPQAVRPYYQDLARSIAGMRGNIVNEIQSLYVIADRLDRAAR